MHLKIPLACSVLRLPLVFGDVRFVFNLPENILFIVLHLLQTNCVPATTLDILEVGDKT